MDTGKVLYIASLYLSLSPEHLQPLDEVSQIELSVAHDFLPNDKN
ncbi:hypothetical protein [Nostoc sp.]